MPGSVVIRNFGGADQQLLVPGQNEDGTAIGRLGVERCARCAGEAGQNDVGSAHAAQHGFAGTHGRALAKTVGPGAGTVQNPSGVDPLIFSGEAIAQKHASSPALGHVDGQYFTVIADYGTGRGRLGHPLGDEAFGKLALRVFVIEHQPLVAGVEGTLHARHFHLAQVGGFLPRDSLVQPQAGANLHRAALALLVQQEQELHGVDQVRALAQKVIPLAHRLPHQTDFPMLQIAKPAVNDTGGTAGYAGREIVLLHQQRPLPGASTFPGDSDPIDAAADHHDMKALRFQEAREV